MNVATEDRPHTLLKESAIPDPHRFREHKTRILVLQGGGSLGAYQAGVFEALDTVGFSPNWVAGVSIGAINSALIAGNPPERRAARVREFWNRVATKVPALPAGMEMFQTAMARMTFANAVAFGIPGFFTPRMLPPAFATSGTLGALSYFDTEPLRATLNELVDFDLINNGDVRLSLGAVNIRTGQSRYFDSTFDRITASHVMASGALPPGFPPVEIDGEHYWDGGVMSNTPLSYVMQDFRQEALVVQVDVFCGVGAMPQTLEQASERLKDIQYQSKQSLSYTLVRRIEEVRSLVADVVAKLPPEMKKDPVVQKLEEVSHRGRLSLVHLLNRTNTHSSDVKDCEFSAGTVDALWHAGHEDVLKIILKHEACHVTELGKDVRVYEV